jgi:CO/xanthine dehydrogenase Mo-binding subunit
VSAAVGAVPYDLRPPAARDYFERFGPGLVVVLPAQRPGPGEWGRGGPPHGGAWVHVGEDGRARAFTGKVEVGQGTRTALTLLVAEELRLPIAAVELTMGDTDVCPWDMGTFGSRSMADAGEHLRLAGAGARGILTEIAAARLGVAASAVQLQDGHARAAGASSPPVPYGTLVAGLRRLEMVSAVAKPLSPSEWTSAGHPAETVGARDVVTGARRYTSDLHPPGMLWGKILFPPSVGAHLRTLDLTRAQAIPGVVTVREGDFVAVAAPDLPIVNAALRAVRAEWVPTAQPSESGIVEYLRAHPADAEDSWDVVHHTIGSVDTALAAAPVTLRETYTTAYIAHVPLETHAALASWETGRLTVWVGTQTPFRAREAVAGALGLPPASVHVIVPPTGAGFGGKHAGDLVLAAARMAKAAGRPVRIAFTREEEFTQAYFRPLAVMEISSGARADGTIDAWEFHNLNAGSSAARIPYRVPNQKIDNQPSESPLDQGPYRSLAAVANNFARESHMDGLAHLVGADPVEYRRRHLADDRLAAVLDAVVKRAGWTPRPTPRTETDGHGRGIAVGVEKGGRVTTYAEVRVGEDRHLELLRIVTGFECGAIVHPSNLRNQVEGGTVMALGGALFEAIHFENGRILNPRLSQYRVPRFRDTPPVEVVLLDRPDLPSQGAGETPLIAVAPAIGNAIFDAVGARIRSLPMVPDGIVP